jgi:hypothetical protein
MAMLISRARWLIGGALFAILVLVMSCSITGTGIRRGNLPPVEVTVGVDGLRFITVVTDDSKCWRPIRGSAGALCSTGSLFKTDRFYIGWLELPGIGTSGRQRPFYQRLFTLRLPS